MFWKGDPILTGTSNLDLAILRIIPGLAGDLGVTGDTPSEMAGTSSGDVTLGESCL